MQMDPGDDWAIDQRRPITPQVYRGLRARIVRNDLKPGDRMSEAEIARGYNISRQPVREAFIKLAGQGLLEVRPRHGTTVSKIAYGAVLDARFLREAFEADIVKLLAGAKEPILIEELRDQIVRQRMARQAEEFIRLDEDFHRRLAEAAGKGGAWSLVEGLKSQMDRVRYLALESFPEDRLTDQHTTLVDAIAKGDMPAAETAIRHHLRELLSDLPRIIAKAPQFFDLPAGLTPVPVAVPTQGGDPR
jgi:DNA-binding GntR family transcriptional regulator